MKVHPSVGAYSLDDMCLQGKSVSLKSAELSGLIVSFFLFCNFTHNFSPTLVYTGKNITTKGQIDHKYDSRTKNIVIFVS